MIAAGSISKSEYRAGMTAHLAKSLGLEAILWLARVQRKRTAHLLGLHVRAAGVPPEWWLERAHWPIESLIGGVEQVTGEFKLQSPHG